MINTVLLLDDVNFNENKNGLESNSVIGLSGTFCYKQSLLKKLTLSRIAFHLSSQNDSATFSQHLNPVIRVSGLFFSCFKSKFYRLVFEMIRNRFVLTSSVSP